MKHSAGVIKRILVAVDGSSRATDVLAYAVALARATEGKLLLLRSFAIPPDMRLAWPLSDEKLEESFRTQAQTDIDALALTIPPELLDAAKVVVGIPWEAICAAARDEHVDLVVIGSHGFSGLDHLLGTTAARVVNHADRPVLVVRTVPPAT